ncbi:hypothetical protein SH203_02848 [Brevundimonas sp. SH203]|uniref:hypothetical protein n=1 Tax=Brevundimonas sp. SH203 TaxID=345167 RepID=UPI0009CC77CD|nr:hypothetical protein [Brevundimonas sp. SH203]GAW42432.1 hypothetical protein SH203_02848 [Brevundimonas sp. SH203]
MSGGVGAAVGEALAAGADMAEVVQAGLFEDLDVQDTGALDAPSPLSAALPSVVRRGRPKGSKNRRTEAVTSWLLGQHRHPLSVIMEAYSMTTIQLAERLGLQKATKTVKEKREVAGGIVEVEVEVKLDYYSNDVLLDLFKLQMRMAEVATPYVAPKITAGGEGESGPTLNVSFAAMNFGGTGVSVPARGVDAGQDLGGGMSVRLGQVGRRQSDEDTTS